MSFNHLEEYTFFVKNPEQAIPKELILFPKQQMAG